MTDFLKDLGAHVRQLGFKGSGQNFRKVEGDFVFVFNIQKSRTGEGFFINLGAQPAFIPAERDAALSSLKAYECVMRERVGDEWPLPPDEPTRLALMREIDIAQDAFFGLVRTLKDALARDSADELIRKFSVGTTQGRVALHLVRAAAALGHVDAAEALVVRGLALAGERAVSLIADLQAVRPAGAGAPA